MKDFLFSFRVAIGKKKILVAQPSFCIKLTFYVLGNFSSADFFQNYFF